MNKKIILICIACIFSCKIFCQNNKHFGLGLQLSPGTNSSFGRENLIINYFFSKEIDVSTAILGYSHYQGFCGGLSVNYSPFYREKGINLVMGMNYTHFLNYSITEGPSEYDYATYKVNGQGYFVPGVGIRKDFINPGDYEGFVSLRLMATYRYSNEDAKVKYSSGTKNLAYESTLNNEIATKFGFNFSIVGVFDFKRNKN